MSVNPSLLPQAKDQAPITPQVATAIGANSAVDAARSVVSKKDSLDFAGYHCPVCLEFDVNENEIQSISICGDALCSKCALDVMNNDEGTCPMCRTKFKKDDLIKNPSLKSYLIGAENVQNNIMRLQAKNRLLQDQLQKQHSSVLKLALDLQKLDTKAQSEMQDIETKFSAETKKYRDQAIEIMVQIEMVKQKETNSNQTYSAMIEDLNNQLLGMDKKFQNLREAHFNLIAKINLEAKVRKEPLTKTLEVANEERKSLLEKINTQTDQLNKSIQKLNHEHTENIQKLNMVNQETIIKAKKIKTGRKEHIESAAKQVENLIKDSNAVKQKIQSINEERDQLLLLSEPEYKQKLELLKDSEALEKENSRLKRILYKEKVEYDFELKQHMLKMAQFEAEYSKEMEKLQNELTRIKKQNAAEMAIEAHLAATTASGAARSSSQSKTINPSLVLVDPKTTQDASIALPRKDKFTELNVHIVRLILKKDTFHGKGLIQIGELMFLEQTLDLTTWVVKLPVKELSDIVKMNQLETELSHLLTTVLIAGLKPILSMLNVPQGLHKTENDTIFEHNVHMCKIIFQKWGNHLKSWDFGEIYCQYFDVLSTPDFDEIVSPLCIKSMEDPNVLDMYLRDEQTCTVLAGLSETSRCIVQAQDNNPKFIKDLQQTNLKHSKLLDEMLREAVSSIIIRSCKATMNNCTVASISNPAASSLLNVDIVNDASVVSGSEKEAADIKTKIDNTKSMNKSSMDKETIFVQLLIKRLESLELTQEEWINGIWILFSRENITDIPLTDELLNVFKQYYLRKGPNWVVEGLWNGDFINILVIRNTFLSTSDRQVQNIGQTIIKIDDYNTAKISFIKRSLSVATIPDEQGQLNFSLLSVGGSVMTSPAMRSLLKITSQAAPITTAAQQQADFSAGGGIQQHRPVPVQPQLPEPPPMQLPVNTVKGSHSKKKKKRK